MKKIFAYKQFAIRSVGAYLPVVFLPLFAFAFFFYESCFNAMRERSLSEHRVLTEMIGAELDRYVADLTEKLATFQVDSDQIEPDEGRIRDLFSAMRASNPELIYLYWINFDHILQVVEPRGANAEGSYAKYPIRFEELSQRPEMIALVYRGDNRDLQFVFIKKFLNQEGQTLGYFAAQVSLSPWVEKARQAVQNHIGMFAAFLPLRNTDDPVEIATAQDPSFWAKINTIRGEKTRLDDRVILGEPHHVKFYQSNTLPVQLLLARSTSQIFSAFQDTAIFGTGMLGFSFLGMLGLMMVVSARVSKGYQSIVSTTNALSNGDWEARTDIKGSDEFAEIGEEINHLAKNLQNTQIRARAVSKSMHEIFSCNNIDMIFRKVVELLCTQCHASVSWFLPNEIGKNVFYASDEVFLGLHGWAWKDHLSQEIDAEKAHDLLRRSANDHTYTFVMRLHSREIGNLRAVFDSAPSDEVVSLLHTVISLVEAAVSKYDAIRKAAKFSAEVELAQAVQRNVLSESLSQANSKRVAYHYQPASRLGGDWFFIIEDLIHDKIYVVLGDVTGHGLAQGLVTTAVRGALDVLSRQIRSSTERRSLTPSAIISYLNHVVECVTEHTKLTMTCLAAEIDFATLKLKVCNAGHTFPILVRSVSGLITADYMHKHQQPMLGKVNDTKLEHQYIDAEYDLCAGDRLVMYTDGLSEAKNIKSGIFSRFLVRTLRKSSGFRTSEELRDEILQIFSYYTQGSQLDDDVCFLVVQIPDDNTERISA